jgi:hypothetical protein
VHKGVVEPDEAWHSKDLVKTRTYMARVGDLRDLLRHKWYVEECLRVFVQEKPDLAAGSVEAGLKGVTGA